jgi:polysaccharide deacetylase 2 family uncharacterized protein YibQ
MELILDDVLIAVSGWKVIAKKLGIPSVQIKLMEAAFNI